MVDNENFNPNMTLLSGSCGYSIDLVCNQNDSIYCYKLHLVNVTSDYIVVAPSETSSAFKKIPFFDKGKQLILNIYRADADILNGRKAVLFDYKLMKTYDKVIGKIKPYLNTIVYIVSTWSPKGLSDIKLSVEWGLMKSFGMNALELTTNKVLAVKKVGRYQIYEEPGELKDKKEYIVHAIPYKNIYHIYAWDEETKDLVDISKI
ncbi:MAG: hypothetical protein NT007_12180 [Candidatus Kapabacteria bacterium]|nr:hypothetical protein [Candidatus Kapabacteria bacterium]